MQDVVFEGDKQETEQKQESEAGEIIADIESTKVEINSKPEKREIVVEVEKSIQGSQNLLGEKHSTPVKCPGCGIVFDPLTQTVSHGVLPIATLPGQAVASVQNPAPVAVSVPAPPLPPPATRAAPLPPKPPVAPPPVISPISKHTPANKIGSPPGRGCMQSLLSSIEAFNYSRLRSAQDRKLPPPPPPTLQNPFVCFDMEKIVARRAAMEQSDDEDDEFDGEWDD